MRRTLPDAAEIDRRLPVWTALADLFLDTDVMLSVPHIARTIVAHDVTIEEAEDWLRRDVRPAFYGNLLSIAGEWAGWPEDFVRDRVLAAWNARAERVLLGENRFMPQDEWTAVVAEVARLRADQAASADDSVSAIQPPPRTRSPA